MLHLIHCEFYFIFLFYLKVLHLLYFAKVQEVKSISYTKEQDIMWIDPTITENFGSVTKWDVNLELFQK